MKSQLISIFLGTLLSLCNGQQVSPTSLKPVVLNEAFTIEGKNKCADPLLPLLMSDSSKAFYGCCAIKPTDAASSLAQCCLLAGSACDILYTKSPRPCKGTPCCPIGKEDDKPYAFVRAFAGNIFTFNLRTEGGFFLNRRAYEITQRGKFTFKGHVVLKNAPPDGDDLCVDTGGNLTMGRMATFMNLRFMGCCDRVPKSPQDSARHCCLTTFSACDGSIDCCRNAPCYNGLCQYDAGRPEEAAYRSKTSVCNGNRPIFRRYAEGNASVKVTATGKCSTPSLPVFHNFSAMTRNFKGRTLMGCCRNRRYKVAQDFRDNCCFLENSVCDDSVSCCKGQFCCGGVCGVIASTPDDTDLVIYPPQPIC